MRRGGRKGEWGGWVGREREREGEGEGGEVKGERGERGERERGGEREGGHAEPST